MFAIIRTRWQTRPLSRRAKRRSSAAPGSLRKKYAGIAYPPNMVRLPNNSTTSGDPRKPVLAGRDPFSDDQAAPLPPNITPLLESFLAAQVHRYTARSFTVDDLAAVARSSQLLI